jgi:hypothetical protein
MNPYESDTRMAWEGPGDRARQFIREYRDVLRGYAAVPDTAEENTLTARTPLKALAASDLSVDMRHLLERYKREHPGTVVHPVAYLTVAAPAATRSVFGFADLPPEEDLVILALTETVASADRVEVRSQVLLLRLGENK